MKNTATHAVIAKIAPPDIPAPTAAAARQHTSKTHECSAYKIPLHRGIWTKAFDMSLARDKSHHHGTCEHSRNQPDTKPNWQFSAINQPHESIGRRTSSGKDHSATKHQPANYRPRHAACCCKLACLRHIEVTHGGTKLHKKNTGTKSNEPNGNAGTKPPFRQLNRRSAQSKISNAVRRPQILNRPMRLPSLARHHHQNGRSISQSFA
ncbi:hypothetical protein GQR58_029139 [Nymphon striatum]|nr:hypothetical protein GQR58_029139 [Nymphon striatum]